MFERGVSTKARLLFLLMALFMLSIPTSSQIDNCCFVNQQCETEEEWVSGYYAFHNSQCAAPSVQSPEGSASQQPQIQVYSHAPQLRQFRNQNRYEQPRRRSNQKRQPQSEPESEPYRELETYSFTIRFGQPDTRTVVAEDGTPIHINANDPAYMCSLNPGSHWCDEE